MVSPPALCELCGCVFAAHGFDVNGTGMILAGLGVICPHCGGNARVLDGIYSNEAGSLKVDHGSSFTRAVADQLNSIAQKAREQKLRPDEILAEVAEVSPELAERLKKQFPLPAFVIILVLIWLIKSVNLEIDIDLSRLIDQAWHISQGDDPERHYDDPPPTPDPIEREEPTPLERPTLAGLQTDRRNRRARRQAKARSRKRRQPD